MSALGQKRPFADPRVARHIDYNIRVRGLTARSSRPYAVAMDRSSLEMVRWTISFAYGEPLLTFANFRKFGTLVKPA
jgi:hypothetical protein